MKRSLLPFTLIDNEELLSDAAENIIFNWLIYDVRAGRSTGKAIRKPVPKNEIRIGDGADYKIYNTDEHQKKIKTGPEEFSTAEQWGWTRVCCHHRYNFWVWYFFVLFFFTISCLSLVYFAASATDGRTTTIIFSSEVSCMFLPFICHAAVYYRQTTTMTTMPIITQQCLRRRYSRTRATTAGASIMT